MISAKMWGIIRKIKKIMIEYFYKENLFFVIQVTIFGLSMMNINLLMSWKVFFIVKQVTIFDCYKIIHGKKVMTFAQINFTMKLNVSLVLYTLYYIIRNASVRGDLVVSLTKLLNSGGTIL